MGVYKYFVSYVYQNKFGQSVFVSLVITCQGLIESEECLKLIVESIQEDANNKNHGLALDVVLLGFTLLKKEH